MILSYVFDWEVGTILSISVPISGILQLIVLVQSCRKIGYSPKLNLPKLDAKIKN